MTLFCNAMWVTELELGDPDQDVKVINPTVSKYANKFLESPFYGGVNNGTLLPNYKALAVHIDLKTFKFSFDKVVFSRETAMFLVQLWFIFSLIGLCLSCSWFDLAKPAFDV